MILMNWFRRPRGLTIWPMSLGLLMLLVLLWTAACDRPAELQRDAGAAHTDQHQVPFHDGAPPVGSQSVQDNGANSETTLPFHDPQNLPAGTLLTSRLKNPISALNPIPNGPCE